MNKKKTQFDCWIDTIERRMGKKFKEIEITVLPISFCQLVGDRLTYNKIKKKNKTIKPIYILTYQAFCYRFDFDIQAILLIFLFKWHLFPN